MFLNIVVVMKLFLNNGEMHDIHCAYYDSTSSHPLRGYSSSAREEWCLLFPSNTVMLSILMEAAARQRHPTVDLSLVVRSFVGTRSLSLETANARNEYSTRGGLIRRSALNG